MISKNGWIQKKVDKMDLKCPFPAVHIQGMHTPYYEMFLRLWGICRLKRNLLDNTMLTSTQTDSISNSPHEFENGSVHYETAADRCNRC